MSLTVCAVKCAAGCDNVLAILMERKILICTPSLKGIGFMKPILE